MDKIYAYDTAKKNDPALSVSHILEAGIILGFIALWIIVAIHRFENFELFANTMYTQPLPQSINTILIILVPAAELGAATLLLFARTRNAGLYLSFGLLLCYTFYILLMLSRILGHIPCSCSSPIPGLSWVQHFWFNLGLTFLAGLAFFLHQQTTRQYR